EEVAGHGLGRTDHHFARVLAQHALDAHGLGQVAGGRGRTVGVDVADLRGIDAGVADGGHHAARRALAVLARGGHVVGVATHAEAGELGIDARAARLRALVFLHHQHAGAVAHDEAVALDVPGPRGLLRLVVAGRQ